MGNKENSVCTWEEQMTVVICMWNMILRMEKGKRPKQQKTSGVGICILFSKTHKSYISAFQLDNTGKSLCLNQYNQQHQYGCLWPLSSS